MKSRWLEFLLSFGEKNRLYTEACIGISVKGKRFILNSPSASKDAIFDIASLTKIVFTTYYFIKRVQKNGQDILSKTIKTLVDLPLSSQFENISVSHLLAHSSGFVPHRRFWETYGMGPVPLRVIVAEILNTELLFEPGKDVLYTDLGFILLGYIIERLENRTLDQVFEDDIKKDLKLTDTFFLKRDNKNYNSRIERIVATSPYFDKKRVWDHNCYMLGGVSGHAGLFSTVSDLLNFAEKIINLQDDTLFLPFFKRQNERFTLGFDTPTGKLSTSGKLRDKNTIGHLGYTGTSVWIYPSMSTAIVFLSNRTLPGAPIRQFNRFRHTIHNAAFMFIENQFI